jgi:hypothetical protein
LHQAEAGIPATPADIAAIAESDTFKLLEEETQLNRGLATTLLSRSSDVFVPFEPRGWHMPLLRGFSAANPAGSIAGTSRYFQPRYACWEDDAAITSLVACWADSAMFQMRQGAAGNPTGETLESWAGQLRAQPSMRVAIAALAFPFPLAPFAGAPEFFDPRVQRRRGDGGDEEEEAQLSLWSTLEAAPLFRSPLYRNLSTTLAPSLGSEHARSHRIRRPVPAAADVGGFGDVDPLSNGARVVAHAYNLRGPGALPDLRYGREEALLRYAYPLRTSNYVGHAFSEQYTLSSTCPVERIFGAEGEWARVPVRATKRRHARRIPGAVGAAAEGAERTVPCASHCAVSFLAGGYLREVAKGCERRGGRISYARAARHMRRSALEVDEWQVLDEEAAALRDTYEHEAPSDEDDDGDDY